VPKIKTKDSNIDPSMKSIAEKRSMSWGIPYIHPENVINLKTLWNLKFYNLFDEISSKNRTFMKKRKFSRKMKTSNSQSFEEFIKKEKFELPSPNRVLFQIPVQKYTHLLQVAKNITFPISNCSD